MAPQRFRLSLTSLEDRTVPSVTPEQLAGAIAQTNAAQEHLDQLIEKQVQNFNVYMVADLKTSLRKVTTDSLESARVLAEYQNDVDVLAQTDGRLGGLFARIAELRYTAGVNAVYATRLTTAVGGVAITGVVDPIPANQPIPLTPPPAPPEPVAPVLDTTTNSGTTGVLPDITATTFRDLGTGVKVQEVSLGQGDAVKDGQDVNVFYTGFLKDGTVFDGNRDKGATTFNTNGVIQGFKQGLIGLQPGGVRNIFIPAALGYGTRGSPPSVPPNADLVFEVKLLSAKDPAPTNTGGTGSGSGGTTGATGTGATGSGSTTTGGGTSGTGASSGAGGTTGTGTSSGSTGTTGTTNPAGTTGTAGTTAAPGTTGNASTNTAGTNNPTGTTTPGTSGTVTPGTTTPVS